MQSCSIIYHNGEDVNLLIELVYRIQATQRPVHLAHFINMD